MTFVTVRADAHGRKVQLSTAVRFRCALPVISKALPAEGPATLRLAKRFESPSAVSSSKLSNTAHSQAQQAEKQNYLLKVGKCWFTVNTNLINLMFF